MLCKKIKITLFYVMIFSLFAFLCNAKALDSVPVSNSTTTSHTTFVPVETNDVLNNPYMGWAPNAKGTYPQPHKLVYAKVTWRELEPLKGVIDFSAFETLNKFAYWKSKDVKIIIRIILDYPRSYEHMDIPDWLYQEIDGTFYDISYGKGFSPNYSHPVLISYHKALIDKLAERYDQDPSIAMIALGSIGHWGEFHTYRSSTFTIPFPDVSIVNQYTRHYMDAFKNKFLLMRRPHQIAADNKLGLYNDTFGVSPHTENFISWINTGYKFWLTGEMMPAMPDYWKFAPSGGELGNSPGLQYLQDSTIPATLQQAADSHLSWLGPCCPANQAIGNSIQTNMDSLLKTMGYRFVLASETHPISLLAGENMQVSMTWNNKGAAPFYYPWPLELSIADINGNIVSSETMQEDIRTWLPGIKNVVCSMVIPANLAPGTYRLCAAIIDPVKGVPSIDLAIEGKRTDGRYTLGQFMVIANSPIPTQVTSMPPPTIFMPMTSQATPTVSTPVTLLPTPTPSAQATPMLTPTKSPTPASLISRRSTDKKKTANR